MIAGPCQLIFWITIECFYQIMSQIAKGLDISWSIKPQFCWTVFIIWSIF